MEVELYFECVVQKMRGERDAAAISLEVVGPYDTFLVKITGGNSIGYSADGAGRVEVVVSTHGGLEDLFLPVGV